LAPKATGCRAAAKQRYVPFSELYVAKKLFGGVLVRVGALLINHIAPLRRTLTPSAQSAQGASASRKVATVTAMNCAGIRPIEYSA
jgi:hypothetical protein